MELLIVVVSGSMMPKSLGEPVRENSGSLQNVGLQRRLFRRVVYPEGFRES